jgi:hypothetical protein
MPDIEQPLGDEQIGDDENFGFIRRCVAWVLWEIEEGRTVECETCGGFFVGEMDDTTQCAACMASDAKEEEEAKGKS